MSIVLAPSGNQFLLVSGRATCSGLDQTSSSLFALFLISLSGMGHLIYVQLVVSTIFPRGKRVVSFLPSTSELPEPDEPVIGERVPGSYFRSRRRPNEDNRRRRPEYDSLCYSPRRNPYLSFPPHPQVGAVTTAETRRACARADSCSGVRRWEGRHVMVGEKMSSFKSLSLLPGGCFAGELIRAGSSFVGSLPAAAEPPPESYGSV